MPRWWAVPRTLARGPVVATLAVLVLISSALLSGIVGYVGLAGQRGLRDQLASATGTAAALQVRTGLAGADQEAAARAFFGRRLGGLHAHLDRSVTVDPAPVVGSHQTVRLGSYDGFGAHARIVAGAWPSTGEAGEAGVTPAAFPESAARTLGLRVGDSVRVEGAGTYAVAALWRPRVANDPFFAADAAADDGPAALAADQLSLGVVVVPESALTHLDPSVSWTITVDSARIRTQDVAPLSRAIARLPDDLEHDGAAAPSGVLAAGGLAGLLHTLDRSQQAALAMRPVPIVVVAVLAILMLALLSALLARQRAPETALLRSRGASRRQLVLVSVGEAAVVAVVPAAVGVGITALAVRLAGGQLPALGWALAAAVTLVALVAMAVPAIAQTRQSTQRQQIDDSGRHVELTTRVTLAAAVLAAVVTTWRFRSLGSALVEGPGGTTSVDPLAVLAPGLLLTAGALAASGLFGLGALLVQRTADRRPGLGIVLGVRQVARRSTTYGVLVILLCIAVGTSVLAAAYSPTQSQAQERLDALLNGAELSATVPPTDPVLPGSYDDALTRLRALPHVRAVLPVEDSTVSVGTTDVRLLGVSADRLPGVLPLSIASLGGELRAAARRPAGAELPGGTRELLLRFDLDGTAGVPDPGDQPPTSATLTTAVWVQAPDGSVQSLSAGDVTVPLTGRTVERELVVRTPGLDEGSRVVAVDATRLRGDPVSLRVIVNGIGAGAAGRTAVPLGNGWRVSPPQPVVGGAAVEGLSGAVGWSAQVPSGLPLAVRLVPPGTSDGLPVVVDRVLSQRLDVHRGDPVTVSLDGARQLPAHVVSVVDRLPGAQGLPVVGADLGTYERVLLANTMFLPTADRIWIATSGAAAVSEVQGVLPPTSTLVTASSRSVAAVVAPASVALWLGAAGTLLLALVGMGCVIASAAQSRREELVVLRAVGIDAVHQGRWRAVELVGVVLAGTVLGVLAGAASIALTVPDLARSTLVADHGDSPPIALAYGPLALSVGGLVLLALVGVAIHGRRTTRDVLVATPSEVRR